VRWGSWLCWGRWIALKEDHVLSDLVFFDKRKLFAPYLILASVVGFAVMHEYWWLLASIPVIVVGMLCSSPNLNLADGCLTQLVLVVSIMCAIVFQSFEFFHIGMVGWFTWLLSSVELAYRFSIRKSGETNVTATTPFRVSHLSCIPPSPTTLWLDATRDTIQSYRRMIDGAVEQLTDEELFRRPAPEVNSVAVILRHLGGNLKSRWTDFLTTDGEKPDRDRDREFMDWEGDRQSLLAHFDEGWQALISALDSINEENIEDRITIRGKEHSIPQAIERSVTHLAYHVGQIVMIARTVHQGEWRWLTIAPGGSGEHNASPWGTSASRGATGDASQETRDQKESQSDAIAPNDDEAASADGLVGRWWLVFRECR